MLSCCSPFRARYKLLVDDIFPAVPEDGLVRNNVEKLIFYARSSPEKLDRIGEYLHEKGRRDIIKKHYQSARHTMEAMNELLVSCDAHTLNLFVGSFTSMVREMLECADYPLRILAARSFVKFSKIDSRAPYYHLRYDFFVSKFSSMCRDEDMNVNIRREVCLAGIKGLRGVIRMTSSNDLGESIWDLAHMKKIIASLLYIMQTRPETLEEWVPEESLSEENAWFFGCETPETCNAHVLAQECFEDLISRASFGHVKNIVNPVIWHLDVHEQWKPNDFALKCFEILAFSIQPQYLHMIVESVMIRLDRNPSSMLAVHTAIGDVLLNTIKIVAKRSPGTTALEVSNLVLARLRSSVIGGECDSQEILISSLAQFTSHLPDYQKVQILSFVMSNILLYAKNKTEYDQASQIASLKCLLMITKCCSSWSISSISQSCLTSLLKLFDLEDSQARLLAHIIFQSLLDKRGNFDKFAKSTMKVEELKKMNRASCSEELNLNCVSCPEELNLNRESCSEELNLNRESCPEELNLNRESCSEELKNMNRASCSEKLNLNRESCPEELNLNRESCPEELNLNRESCSEELKNMNRASCSEKLNLNRASCSEKLNLNRESCSEELNRNRASCSEELNLNREGCSEELKNMNSKSFSTSNITFFSINCSEIFASFLQSYKHDNNTLENLSAVCKSLSLLCLECVCPQTLPDFFTFLVRLQELALNSTSKQEVVRNEIHANIISLLLHSTTIHGLNATGQYACKILDARKLAGLMQLIPKDCDLEREVFNDSTNREVFNDSTNREVFNDSTNRGVFNDSTNREVFNDSTNQEVLNDSTNREVFNDSTNREVFNDSTNRGVFNDSTNREVFNDSTNQEVLNDSTNREGFNDSTNREVFNDSTNSPTSFTKNVYLDLSVLADCLKQDGLDMLRVKQDGLDMLCEKQDRSNTFCMKQDGLNTLFMKQDGLDTLCMKQDEMDTPCMKQDGLDTLCMTPTMYTRHPESTMSQTQSSSADDSSDNDTFGSMERRGAFYIHQKCLPDDLTFGAMKDVMTESSDKVCQREQTNDAEIFDKYKKLSFEALYSFLEENEKTYLPRELDIIFCNLERDNETTPRNAIINSSLDYSFLIDQTLYPEVFVY